MDGGDSHFFKIPFVDDSGASVFSSLTLAKKMYLS